MRDKILEIIQNKPKHFSKLVKNSPDLLSWVVANSKIQSLNFAEMIYSAVHQCTNICSNGKIKKFKSFNEGHRFCGSAGVCLCAKGSVSQKVSAAKKSYSSIKKAEIAKKRSCTSMKKYGVSNNGQTPTAKQRHAEHYQTVAKKERPKKLTTYQKLDIKYRKQALVSFKTPESEYAGVDNQKYYDFQCLSCSTTFSDYIDNGHLPVCKICHPYNPSYVSKQETEVYDFVKSITNNDVHRTDKSIINPFEIDIVVPTRKIAIEYCGLYWHSEVVKAKTTYHQDKFLKCQQKGYRLVTIFEDEWIKKQEIVKKRLRSILQVDEKIYARKCQVKEIPNTIATEFIDANHLQGNSVFKIAIGCYYNDTLVAVMTFGKPRYDKKAQYELIRYCSTDTVVGGASKMFSFFVKKYNPDSIISYCDLRWGTGNLYQKLGFTKYAGIVRPSYSYTDFVNRYHRSKFTKKRLCKTKDDVFKTEKELANSMKLYRIWDCGQDKWVWKSPNCNQAPDR